MPKANAFLSEEEFAGEIFFDLKAAFCPSCKMVQLLDQPARESMFHDGYPFLSGSSSHMASHFQSLARDVLEHFIPDPTAFVVEIGTNDGTLLKHFSEAGIRHLGIEPSAGVARAAQEHGVQVHSGFFDEALALHIVRDSGPADVFLAANVMCHISYLHSALEGIRILLKTKGVAIFEDPYLCDMLRQTSYDQIYDEHAFVFSLTSLQNALQPHGLRVIDVNPQQTHGGSMRYTVAREGEHVPSKGVEKLFAAEKKSGVADFSTYEKFRIRCGKSKKDLVRLLTDLKQKRKRVLGYGAASKSTTVLNFCGIGREFVEAICDSTPAKQGKFSPGAHLPIVPSRAFRAPYPDFALLFAWNHAKEILEKEKEFTAQGGKWIAYVPEVKILG